MKTKVILTDLRSDGAMPTDCEILVSYEPDERLKLRFEALDLEIDIPLYTLGLVLGNEEHG